MANNDFEKYLDSIGAEWVRRGDTYAVTLKNAPEVAALSMNDCPPELLPHEHNVLPESICGNRYAVDRGERPAASSSGPASIVVSGIPARAARRSARVRRRRRRPARASLLIGGWAI